MRCCNDNVMRRVLKWLQAGFIWSSLVCERLSLLWLWVPLLQRRSKSCRGNAGRRVPGLFGVRSLTKALAVNVYTTPSGDHMNCMERILNFPQLQPANVQKKKDNSKFWVWHLFRELYYKVVLLKRVSCTRSRRAVDRECDAVAEIPNEPDAECERNARKPW